MLREWVLSVGVVMLMVMPGRTWADDWSEFHWFSYKGWDDVKAHQEAAPGAGKKSAAFTNPVIGGFYPDPSVVRVNETYYLVNSSFAYFPGLPIFKSKNLVDWEQIGNAYSSRSQWTFERGQKISRGIFAPTLRYHKGEFYIITTDVIGIGNFIIHAKNPAGPWSKPILLPEVGGIDPDLFFDTDGRVYITHNDKPKGKPLYNGHRAIWMWELDWATKKILPKSRRLLVDGGVDIKQNPIWIEAPHLFKKDGWYYLICAEGGTGTDHSQVVFRARSLGAPFEPYKNNPILTQRDLDPARANAVTSTGHADFVTTPNGDWWAVFLGVRPYAGEHHNTGRETFLLPVTWKNGWPHILPKGQALPLSLPFAMGQRQNVLPQAGGIYWRDDFKNQQLGLAWVSARTTPEPFYKIDHKPVGKLLLKPKAISLVETAHASMLVRRQQNLNYQVETKMILPNKPDVQSGLIAYHSERFHYFLGVQKTKQGHELFLETVEGGKAHRSKPLPLKSGLRHVVLGVSQSGDKLIFSYRGKESSQKAVFGAQSASLISTQTAGGFVGVTLGVHARTVTVKEN